MDLQCSASHVITWAPVSWSDPTFGGSGTGTGTVSGTATLAISPSPWAKMTRDRSSVSTTGTSTWWKYGYSRIFNSWLCRIFHGNMNFHGSSSRFRKKLPHSEPPHMLHHGGPRHVHMHILWRAWHVVGVVDGLHNLAPNCGWPAIQTQHVTSGFLQKLRWHDTHQWPFQ